MKSGDHQMHLALYVDGVGGHVGAWRQPEAEFGAENFSFIARCAAIVEKAKFDMVFVADQPVSVPVAGSVMRLEPLTMLAALAGVTKQIGLAATVSTTYSEPFNLARMIGSIDHITGGRAGWNVVTTFNPDAAANYGRKEHMSKAERYEAAAEYVEIVKGLWDSWEDDAILADKEGGRLFDPTKRHVLNHEGKYYSVRGPLNQSRPPQGYPVILQAGSSETGLHFAAKTGEVIFIVQEDMEATRAYCAQLRDLAVREGRDPDQIRIMSGVCPFIAESEKKAKEMLWRLSEMTDTEAAWSKLSNRLGVDVSKLNPEGPIPAIPSDEMRGHAKTLTAVAAKHGFNLRQLRDYAAAASGHRLVFGTPEMVADDLEHWFRSGAGDGFVVIPPYLTASLEAFTEQVVPILQKRGLFRKEYTGRTLRDHLGLSRPPHPAARRVKAVPHEAVSA